MADWNGSTASIIRPYLSYYGSPRVRWFEESTAAATAVIRRGDIVTFDTVVTSNAIRIVRAPSSGGAGANLMQVGIKSLVGVALQDSTSDGSTTGLLSSGGIGTDRRRFLPVALATQETEFLGYLSTVGGAIAASTIIGLNRGVRYDRNLSRYMVDSTNSTAADAAVHITGIPDGVMGDSGATPVIFKFLSTNVAPAVGGGNQ